MGDITEVGTYSLIKSSRTRTVLNAKTLTPRLLRQDSYAKMSDNALKGLGTSTSMRIDLFRSCAYIELFLGFDAPITPSKSP